MDDQFSHIDDLFRDKMGGAEDFSRQEEMWANLQPQLATGTGWAGKLVSWDSIKGLALNSLTLASALTLALLTVKSDQPGIEPPNEQPEYYNSAFAALINANPEKGEDPVASETVVPKSKVIQIQPVAAFTSTSQVNLKKPEMRSAAVVVDKSIARETSPEVALIPEPTTTTSSLPETRTMLLKAPGFLPENLSVQDIKSQSNPEDLSPLEGRKWGVSLIGGAHGSHGFSVSRNSSDPFVITPFAGLGVHYQVSGNFIIQAQGSYLRRSGHALTYTSTQQRVFLTPEEVVQKVEVDVAEYFHMPVSIQFQPASRHFIEAGGFASFLINTEGDRQEIVTGPEVNQVKDLGRERGFTQGISETVYGVTAGYEFQVLPSYRIGFRINQGLNDIIDDDFFEKDPQQEKVRDYQLYLKFKLF